MKFATILAAMALAGSAFAIESSNIVGYNTKDVSVLSPISATFTMVDGGEAFTFGDYKVNCDETDPDATTGWLANADSFNTYSSVGAYKASYIYCPAWLAEALTADFGYTVAPGWYDVNDEEFKTNCNTMPIPFGNGIVAKSSGSGAHATFAGQVKKNPTVTDIGVFTVAGNASPKTISIGEIVVNCDEKDPDATTGWAANADGIYTYTEAGSFKAEYIYCPAWLAEALTADFGYSVTAGWYDVTDEAFSNNLGATVKFAAGEGFIAKASFSGATLTIKSALAE